MQTVWFLEHAEGGKWWHVLYGWVSKQEHAARFAFEHDAKNFQADTPHLSGAKIVHARVDDNRFAGAIASVDYDPYSPQEREKNG